MVRFLEPSARIPLVRLSDDMKRVVLEQRLGFAATVCEDGTPNLSPKGTTTVLDDEHLLFADIHSPGTVRNVERNRMIELNVVDPIVRKGYRFKGTAALHGDGETYEEALRVLCERGYDAIPERIKTVVVVEVESAAPLVSPVYDGGASEKQVAQVWERRVAQLAQLRTGTHTEADDAKLVRRFHELQGAFYGGGPIEPLVDLLSEDVRWHVPGRSAIAGDYVGREDVLAYFMRRRELARARFRLGAVSVNLQRASANIVTDLLADAWENRSPKRLTNAREAPAYAGSRKNCSPFGPRGASVRPRSQTKTPPEA